MQRGSRWLSAVIVAVWAWGALSQSTDSKKIPATSSRPLNTTTRTDSGPLAITALAPERATPGETVLMYVTADLSGLGLETADPRGVEFERRLVVLVAGEKAVVHRVRGSTVWFDVPQTLTRGEVPVVVIRNGKRSEAASLYIASLAPTATTDSTTEPAQRTETAERPVETAPLFSSDVVAAVLVGGLVLGALLTYLIPWLGRHVVGQSERRRPRGDEAPLSRLDTIIVQAPEPRIAQPVPPPELVRACADGECVLFAGPGLDQIVRYPTLRAVLKEVIDETTISPEMQLRLRQGLAQGETDAVLDILLATEAAPALAECVERRYRDAPPQRGALDELRVIEFASVVTTSWTPLLAQVFRGRNPLDIPLRSSENNTELLQSMRFAIIRLLGHAAAPESLILTRAEMRQLIRRNDFFSKYLTSLLSSRTHLFVGTSLETIDDYFSALQWAPWSVRHFAVLEADPKTMLERERLRARYGIEVIETPVASDHKATHRFVEDLSRAVRTDKASSSRQRPADVPTLGRLVLQNIGAFPSLDLTLTPGWNVILGNNASGKSTILRAIAAALCGDDPRAAIVAERLLHAGASSGFVELTIGNDVYRAEFIRELKRVRIVNRQLTPLQTGKALVLGFPAIRGVASAKGAAADSSGDVLPSPDVSDILPLIAGDTDPRTDSVKQWLIDLESRRLRAGGESWRLAELRNKFFDLLNLFTPGLPIQFANVDFDARQVFVKGGDAIIPLDYVSQGMISVVAWVGTLLQRMYAVRAKSEDPTKEAAIVLIDELDAHLHPEWQQEIVTRLKAQFPNVQFIATTHSPLVVAGLHREEVFLAARDPEDSSRITVVPSPIHFEGLRADQILTSPLFGLSSTRGPHVDRYTQLLAQRERTADEERELEILRGAIAETEEVLKTRRTRHALDQLTSEEGFEALLAGREIAPEMRERLLAAISREDPKA